MKYDELIERKKKRTPRRFIKFIFFVIFIIIIGSLIFYSIDNPGFLNSIKEKLVSFYSASGNSTDTAINSGTAVSVDNSTGDTAGNNLTSTQALSSDKNNTSQISSNSGAGSIWDKIISFFSSKFGGKDDKNFPAKIKINLYFSDIGENDKFISEKRTINGGDLKTAVNNAVIELLKGPEKTYHFPVIPSGTRLLGVEIYENIAKINLSEDFLNKSLDSGILDEYVIYTIVDTITEIQGIEGVIFLVDGKRIKQYGKVDLSIPAIRNDKYLSEDSQ